MRHNNTQHVYTFRLLRGSDDEWSAMLRGRLRRTLQRLQGALDAPEIDDYDLSMKLEHCGDTDLNAVATWLNTPLLDAVLARIDARNKRDQCGIPFKVVQYMLTEWDNFVDACRRVCRDDTLPDIVLEVTRYEPIGMTAERWTFWAEGWRCVELDFVPHEGTSETVEIPVPTNGTEGARRVEDGDAWKKLRGRDRQAIYNSFQRRSDELKAGIDDE